jgi:polar amino acid transport system substrate-binding protein
MIQQALPESWTRRPRGRRRLRLGASLIAALALAATGGCALSDSSSTGAAAPTAGTSAAPAAARVPEIAAMLPKKYQDSGQITAAATTGLPPMMYIDQDGHTIVGVEADLLRKVGDVLGVRMVMEDSKTEAFMAGISSGRFDLAAGSITYTPERAAQADFVVYAQYGQALAKAAGNNDDITFANACGKAVAVLNGSIQQTKFLPELDRACTSAGRPAIEQTTFPDPNAMFLAATSGRVDAVFLNEPAIKYQIALSGGKLVLADSGYSSDPKGLVVGKNTGLQDAVLAAVRHLAETGDLKADFDEGGIGDVLTGTPALNAAG